MRLVFGILLGSALLGTPAVADETPSLDHLLERGNEDLRVSVVAFERSDLWTSEGDAELSANWHQRGCTYGTLAEIYAHTISFSCQLRGCAEEMPQEAAALNMQAESLLSERACDLQETD